MFLKGLVHGFGQKCYKTIKHKKLKKSIHGTSEKFEIFHLFILGKIGQENVFDDILERKKVFLDSKITKFRKSKIWYFSKGVGPWFWSTI